MKVRDTSPGRLYALSSEIGCTAINGAMAVDIPAGGQVVVLALDKKIVIDGDDAAKFVEVRWGTNTVVGSRPVPAWLSDVLAGLISIVGDDNFDINYMPAENKLIVHTDRVDDTTLEAVTDMLERFVPADIEVVQYNFYIELSYEEYMKYSSFTRMSDLRAAYPDYRDDVTPTGVWAYNLDNMYEIHGWFAGGWDRLFQNADKIKKLYVNLPKLTRDSNWIVNGCDNLEELEITYHTSGIGGTPKDCPKLKRVKLHVPNATRLDSCLNGCPLVESWEVVVDWENVTKIIGSFSFPAITHWDIPLPKCTSMCWTSFWSSFTSFNVELPALQNGYLTFSSCCLDKASVLRICNSIPSVVLDESLPHGDGRLSLGINIAHQDDAEVLAAIDAATAKGWLVTTRWNTPPATASTASTLALWDEEETNPIYARIVEAPEYGDYVTPEGARVIIDWGHLVTSPDGKTPEEMGYEQYVSIGEVMYKHNLSYYTESLETDN